MIASQMPLAASNGRQEDAGLSVPQKPKTDPDLEAIDRVLAGDEEAYAEVIRRHERPLRRIVTGIVADPHLAEDVLQEAYLIAYRQLTNFRRDAPFGAWLYRITVREAVRARTRVRRVWRDWLPLDEGELGSEGEHGTRVEELEDALAVLRKLPTKERTAFVLHILENRSYGEIADLLGSTTGTVGSLIHRARARIERLTGGDVLPRSGKRPAESSPAASVDATSREASIEVIRGERT